MVHLIPWTGARPIGAYLLPMFWTAFVATYLFGSRIGALVGVFCATACAADADCAAKAGGNACIGTFACSGNVCTLLPATVVVCPPAGPCKTVACAPQTGQCVSSPAAGPCNDGDDCSTDDQCSDGKCTAGKPKSCSDGNDCTDDGCTQGKCTNVPHTKPCNDGNGCTTGDTCSPKGCAGIAKSCLDTIDCTVDECAPATGECVHKPVNSVCEDSDPCTTYTCNVAAGCQWQPTDRKSVV